MLQLRKDTQELLDKLNLSQLHLAKYGSSLSFVGECGKTVMNIKGIEVPSKFTKSERNIVYDLIKKYLDKNYKDVQEIVKLSSEINNVDYEVAGYQLKSANAYDNYDFELKYSSTIDIGIKKSGSELFIGVDSHGVNVKEVLTCISKKSKFVKILQNFRKQIEEHDKNVKRISELNSCNI